jgi:cell wall-associated NlpC family hydrolase
MTLDEFSDVAITIPFVIGGRDWTGWDCWGLIYLAYASVPALGGPVSSYAAEYDSRLSYPELARLIDRERPEWRSIVEPQPGDISLYRVGVHASHVALVTNGARMLHSENSVGTVSEPLNNRIWANRHVGYFRRNV